MRGDIVINRRLHWVWIFVVASCAAPQPSPSGATPVTSAAPPAASSPPVAQAPTPPSQTALAAAQPSVAGVQPLTTQEGVIAQGEACLSCHSIQLIESSRIGEAGWKAELIKMRNWGALVDEAKVAPFASWFAGHYPANELRAAAIQISTTEAAAAVAPERGSGTIHGDRQAGAMEYTKDCASCHGAGAEGTGGGPVLIESPVLYQPGRFSTLIGKGEGRMPAYPLLTQVDINNLLEYLRGIR